MPNRTSSDRPIQIARGLLALNGVIWFLFGVTSLLELTRRYPEQKLIYTLVGILMFANVAALLLSAWLVGKPWKWGYYLALAVLLANVLLTFTDQVGFFDWVTLLLDLAILGLLVVHRIQSRSRSQALVAQTTVEKQDR